MAEAVVVLGSHGNKVILQHLRASAAWLLLGFEYASALLSLSRTSVASSLINTGLGLSELNGKKNPLLNQRELYAVSR